LVWEELSSVYQYLLVSIYLSIYVFIGPLNLSHKLSNGTSIIAVVFTSIGGSLSYANNKVTNEVNIKVTNEVGRDGSVNGVNTSIFDQMVSISSGMIDISINLRIYICIYLCI
jgi:hypothetical protein